jgi:hypothetical protein
VQDVHLADEAFTGDRSSYLPDAIVTWAGAPPASHVCSKTLGGVTAELATGCAGNHRSDGFCIVLDPRSGQRAEALCGHIWGLAPMVLRSCDGAL